VNEPLYQLIRAGEPKMKALMTLILITVTGAVEIPDSLSSDTLFPRPALSGYDSSRILIARGNSGLEYNVSDLIREHFEAQGFEVVIIPLQTIGRRTGEMFEAVIMLNAVKKNNLSPQPRRYMSKIDKLDDTLRPLVLISTISGAAWSPSPKKSDSDIDAVSTATEKVHVGDVAQRIIQRVSRMIAERKEVTRSVSIDTTSTR